jgi:hypothetical protein
MGNTEGNSDRTEFLAQYAHYPDQPGAPTRELILGDPSLGAGPLPPAGGSEAKAMMNSRAVLGIFLAFAVAAVIVILARF